MKKIKKMTSYELHSCLFDILNEIDRIFKKNGIEYFLAFGTLLGCVRGGEQIKWDDDLDICVKEEYWQSMNEALLRELDNNKFFLVNRQTSKNSPDWRYMTRVGLKGTYRRMDYYKDKQLEDGIFVEIAELVNIPDLSFNRKKWNYILGLIDGVINLLSYKEGTYEKPSFLSYLLKNLFGSNSVYDWNCIRYRIQTRYCGKESKLIAVPFGPYGVYSLEKTSFKKQWFKDFEYKDFVVKNSKGIIIRKGQFPVPVEYNEVLCKTYGNWHVKPKGRRSKDVSYWRDYL